MWAIHLRRLCVGLAERVEGMVSLGSVVCVNTTETIFESRTLRDLT